MDQQKQSESQEKAKQGVPTQIAELEKQIATTKYNKKTQHAIGQMKAKLARLREKQEQRSSKKSKGTGYAVRKSGDCTVVLLGFPSVGKSTLLNVLTNQESKVGSYAFTTLTVIPGLMEYNHAKIQILDVPGIVEGASDGTGRGKEVLQVLRSADMILILLDAQHPEHYHVIKKEIYNTGIRINKQIPDVQIKRKTKGGISVSSTVRLTKIDEETIVSICKVYRIVNADILIRDDITDDELIDVLENNRIYTKAITVLNKIDMVSPQEQERIRNMLPIDLIISANKKFNTESLKRIIFESLSLMPIFLKEVRKEADLNEPMVLSKGATLGDLCRKIHKDFVRKFRFARIWGDSVKFSGQKIQKFDHVLKANDVVEIHIK